MAAKKQTESASDEKWEWLLRLTSVPLRELGDNLLPIDAGSGCIVQYGESRLLLTVAHVTGNYGRWAIEVGGMSDGTTKLYKLGGLNYIAELGLTEFLNLNPERIEDHRVDLAYVQIPEDVQPVYALYDGRHKVEELPRLILRTDLSARPNPEMRYGFSGQVQVNRVGHELHADVQLETNLRFVDQVGSEYIFDLGHSNAGDKFYKGCSGAPVLSQDGDLVGLVLGRLEDDPERIRVVALADYKAMIDTVIRTEE